SSGRWLIWQAAGSIHSPTMHRIILIIVALCLMSCSLLNKRLIEVPTGSMANTIIPGDKLLMTTEVGTIKRGDVVVFKLPANPSVLYTKRIIGMPGETIRVKDMKVWIDGREIPERRVMIDLTSEQTPYKELSSEGKGSWTVYYDRQTDHSVEISGMKYAAGEPFKIPAGQYFVLGDCRDNALDSRFWGTVPAANIVGKPTLIYSSLDKSARPPRERPERAGVKVK